MARDMEELVRSMAIDGIVVSNRASGRVHDAIVHLVSMGRLEDVARGVWKLRDHPWDRRSELRAALAIAGSSSVVGLRTAAQIYGWYRYRTFAGVEVIVSRGLDQRTSIGRIVQTRTLPPHHVIEVDGFPLTTPARTFFDLRGDPDPGLRRRGGHPIHARNMERVYNDILARRGVTFAHEAAVHLVMARQGRRGTVLVRELLSRLGPRYVPTHSEAESLFVELLAAHSIDPPERQVAISGIDGFIGSVDFFWPTAGHVVEIDSSWHDGPLEEQSDGVRDARLLAAGYTVARYRYGRMVTEPAAIARELGVALRPGGPTTTPSS